MQKVLVVETIQRRFWKLELKRFKCSSFKEPNQMPPMVQKIDHKKLAHNIKKRTQYCINADGGHFEYLL